MTGEQLKEFRKEVIDALEKFSKKEIETFAWRCGVRALPCLGFEDEFGFWDNGSRSSRLLPFFRTLDFIAADIVMSYSTFGANAYEEASHINVNFIMGSNVGYISRSIASAANVSNAITDSELSKSKLENYAANAAEFAVGAANYVNMPLAQVIRLDLQRTEISTSYDVYGKLWPNFLEALEKEGCGYWGNVVKEWFDSEFQIDLDATRKRLNVPKEIQEQGAAAVSHYLEELEHQGSSHLNEARVIILGDKGAGKTSIARKLIDPKAKMPKEKDSTAGVDTTLWSLIEEDFNVRIWDFAGHTVTHAVHRFFLSERCLYIIVVSSRTESSHQIEYWLDQMKNYGGESQALLLVNKKDDHEPDIQINRLRRNYPIAGIAYFSIKDDEEKLYVFRNHVRDYLLDNPSWQKQELPKSYYEVKESLESLFSRENKERISTDEFEEIASDHGIESQEHLLSVLNALGICLWYKEIDGLSSLVLNPEWISKGVYKVMNWAKNHGLSAVKLTDFKMIFEEDTEKYPVEEQRFLFELMLHYKLGYTANKQSAAQLVNQRSQLYIPFLFQSDEPEQLPEFSVEESLMVRYDHQRDLPPDTITRFIVEHNQDIMQIGNEKKVWRRGVLLKSDMGALALVLEERDAIQLSIKGDHKEEYLNILRTTLDEIFGTYRTKEPKQLYRVKRENSVPANLETEEPIWLTRERLAAMARKNVPHWDDITGEAIDVGRVVNIYNITVQGNYVHGAVRGDLVGRDQTNFNFQECNINLQSNFNELANKLAKRGFREEAEDLTELAETLEENKEVTEPEEIKRKGLANQIKRVVEEMADEKSTLHKGIKAIKNGKKIASDIMGWYNQMVQKGICPPVESLF